MTKIKVWYERKHDDLRGEGEAEIGKSNLVEAVWQIYQSGGVFLDGGFVPWHCISYIEVAK